MAETNFTALDWIIVGAYLLGTVAIGLWVNRYIRGMGDFLVAGRSLRTRLGIATMIGSELGLVTAMFAAQKGFTTGFAAFHIGLMAGIATLVVGITGFIVVPLRRMGVMTIPPDVAAQSYAGSFKWKTSTGADRYRRGMYTFFKRTAADPNLIAFDCPDANVTVAKRNRSNTPIMALATLGNEVFHEAAQAMAKRILSNSSLPDESARIDYCFLLCTARKATPEERTVIVSLLEKSRAYYAKNPPEAGKLAGTHRLKQIPAADNAAWIATARIILNLDETITRQ